MFFPAILASSSGKRRRLPLAADDWLERAAEADVLADALNTSTKLVSTATIDENRWLLGNSTADHVVFAGDSWQFNVLNTDSTASGDVGVYFGNIATFGNGETVRYSFEAYAPPEFCWSPWPFTGGGGSHKLCIMSDRLSSNRPNEVVLQMNYGGNQVNGYWQDGVSSSVTSDVGYSSEVNSSDFRRQPAVDRGVNPLTGVNPDTGAAWSLWQQQRARYGLLYSAQSANEFRRGYGDPFSGGFRQYPNEWMFFAGQIDVGTFGSFNSRWRLWAARQGQAPVLIHDAQNIRLGSGPDYNTLWMTPYTSDRLPGGRSVTARTNPIPGLTLCGAAGIATPIGDGTLEYNASTGRVRYFPAGQSYGSAVGFSSANGILTRNVISGSGGDNFVIVTANPALLPSSGTHTETVTIADGRPDTYIKFRRVRILSGSAVFKAPGGYTLS